LPDHEPQSGSVALPDTNHGEPSKRQGQYSPECAVAQGLLYFVPLRLCGALAGNQRKRLEQKQKRAERRSAPPVLEPGEVD
jgi:hypothetical protein